MFSLSLSLSAWQVWLKKIDLLVKSFDQRVVVARDACVSQQFRHCDIVIYHHCANHHRNFRMQRFLADLRSSSSILFISNADFCSRCILRYENIFRHFLHCVCLLFTADAFACKTSYFMGFCPMQCSDIKTNCMCATTSCANGERRTREKRGKIGCMSACLSTLRRYAYGHSDTLNNEHTSACTRNATLTLSSADEFMQFLPSAHCSLQTVMRSFGWHMLNSAIQCRGDNFQWGTRREGDRDPTFILLNGPFPSSLFICFCN